MEKFFRFFLMSVFALSLGTFAVFSEPALAGAALPFSSEWYRNPVLQGQRPPELVSSSCLNIPVGWLRLFNPNTFPYALLEGEISPELDFDLLPNYIQLSNPFMMIINSPESPDVINISISKQNIKISDESGYPLSVNSIPGQGAFSVNRTPLIPPPLIAFHKRLDNIFLGVGLFGGTSGISFFLNNDMLSLLSQPEIAPGDNLFLRAEISARTGLFEYINFILNPIYLSDTIKIEFATRIFFYQTLAELRGSSLMRMEIADEYIFSEVNTETGLFYLYPGEGIGVGGRLDLGALFTLDDFTFGIGFLNVLGMEYSTGLELRENAFEESSGLYYPVRPYCLFHTSYLFQVGENILIIPIIDFGYGKTFFSHAALAAYGKTLSLKMGIAFEDRMKGSVGFGIQLGRFLLESGIIMQQSVFEKRLAGIFLSLGLGK